MKTIKAIIFIIGLVSVPSAQCMESSCRAMQIRKPLHFTSNGFAHEIQKIMHRHTTLDNNEHAALLIGYMNKNNIEVVEFLIKNPPINPTSIPAFYNSGKSVLHHAVKQKNPYFVSLLLSNNQVDPNTVNEWGETPLYVAIEEQAVDCIHLFVQNRRTDVNKNKPCSFSPLQLSTYMENVNCTQLLLTRSDLHINVKNGECSPIFYAIQPALIAFFDDQRITHTNIGHLEALLTHPSLQTNCINEWGYTPLIYSVISLNIDCVKLLLKNDLTDINKCGEYSTDTPFISAILTGNAELIDIFIDNPKTDINAITESGYTALMHAAQQRNSYCVGKLLNKPHLTTINNQSESFGETALHLAVAKHDNIECVRLLLATPYHNLNVNLPTATEYCEETPLARATSDNEIEYVKLLLADPRTNINAQYKQNGRTSLFLAVVCGYVDLVKLFLAYNADVTITNKKGLTPLDKATKKQYTEIIALLQSHMNH